MATRPELKVWSAPITASVSLVCMTAFPPLRLRALRASSSSTPSCVRPLPKSSRPCATRVTAPTMPRATWATPCAIAAARLKHSLLPYCAKSVVSSVISANPPASSTPRLSLKAENARAAMECRLVQAQKDCCCEMNQRFDRLDCKLDNMQRDSEIARLTRENEALKNKAIADSTAASVVQSLQGFALSHYKPTQTATAPTA